MIYELDGGPLGDNPIEGILIFGNLDPVFGIDFPVYRYGSGSALFKDCGLGGTCGDIGISGVPSGQSSSINHRSLTSELLQVTAVPIPATIWLIGSAILGLFGIRKSKTSR